MNYNDAKQEIKSRWKELYPMAKDKKGVICPLCGHGAGGDGIVVNKASKDKDALKCFSCGFSGDVISLIMQDTGKDFKDAIEYAADYLGIALDEPAIPLTDFKPIEPEAMKTQNDYRNYYEKCAANIQQEPAAQYLKSRGISIETAARFGVGYDEQADPAGKGFKEPRIILPVNRSYYIARRIKDKQDNFNKMNSKGETDIFNKDILYKGSGVVFVVEGYLDALAVYEAGGEAIALNGLGNKNKLIEMLEKRPTKKTIMLSLDNDQPGENAAGEIADALKRLNISYFKWNISGQYKDPNEALYNDKEVLKGVIGVATEYAKKPDNIDYYLSCIMQKEIERFKNANKLKTGFENLDEKAGGIYPGLYCIAAISSLGKTTFSHQIADNIAASGNDVLFFSLEQSRLELVSKSINRIVSKETNLREPATSLSIREGYLSENVVEAAELYQQAAGDKMSIIEGNFNCNINYIGDYVRKYIAANGGKDQCKPVVFIDYLQILQADPAGSSRQKREMVDNAVTELKRISRENEIPVFIISSVNRTNYLTPIDFESLKESGGIEYTCDVIWGLQLQALNSDIFDKEKKIKEKRELIQAAKKADPRKIELVCLKNRYGISNFNCYFDYYPKHDYFVPGVLSQEFE